MAPKETTSELIDQVQFVEYSDPGYHEAIAFRLDPGTETFWATQAQIAELFQTERSNVTKHLRKVFEDGELNEVSNVQKVHIAGSTKPVQIYSLDAVISVGYRVNSQAATRFRQRSTAVLKSYLTQGYAINERALRESPEKLDALAARLRALRSEEKQVFSKVRDCFRMSASDYSPGSKEMKRFYALLQDKFHFAVTSMTASKLMRDRADHTVPNMGVQNFKGQQPTVSEALVGKNYLLPQELYRLHLLSEQFLLFAESTALSGQKMTMQSLHGQLDRLLTLNNYKVFDDWKDFIKPEAERHVRAEIALYRKRLKLEAMGIEYDEIAMEDGEYDDLLNQ
ncbi:RhuM family protein [Paracoccus sp. (in: a-proteobacteria)]|uniref:RhuM family protein n=1 Tax=Paracoccus sp. TaxID=267 RepID=UPI002899B920|nr:RhuM family protein [Paracoccus sp. (in: a-proteobacteria)]